MEGADIGNPEKPVHQRESDEYLDESIPAQEQSSGTERHHDSLRSPRLAERACNEPDRRYLLDCSQMSRALHYVV